MNEKGKNVLAPKVPKGTVVSLLLPGSLFLGRVRDRSGQTHKQC